MNYVQVIHMDLSFLLVDGEYYMYFICIFVAFFLLGMIVANPVARLGGNSCT